MDTIIRRNYRVIPGVGGTVVVPAGGSSTLNTSLIASWKLADVNDAVGGLTLTNNNSVSFASAGKIGNCGTFTAASSMYLSRADGADIQVVNEDFSFAFWVKFNNVTTGSEYLVAKANGNPDDCFKIFKNATTVEFLLTASSTSGASLSGLSTGVWYSIIAVHDSVNNTLQVWIDNSITNGSVVHTTGANDDDAAFTIGARKGPDSFFDGAIDNVNFWRKVLTSAERAEWHNSGTGKEYPY